MFISIASVGHVHLINADSVADGYRLSDQSYSVGCKSTFPVAIYYCYSAPKLMLIYHPTEGGWLS